MSTVNLKLASVPQKKENSSYQIILWDILMILSSLYISVKHVSCRSSFDVRLRHLTLHEFLLYEQILTKNIAFTATGTWRWCGP